MQSIQAVIEDVIRQIQEQKSFVAPAITQESRLIADLGFSSLDIAQLIAYLEMELEVDPFTQGALLSEIRTVGSLCEIYQSCLAKAQEEGSSK